MLQIQTLVIQFASSLQLQLAAVEARDAKFADQLRRSLLSVMRRCRTQSRMASES